MGEQKSHINNPRHQTWQGWWVGLGGAALLVLILLGQANVLAEPAADRTNQTVPQRTPTSEPTQVPTVTPTREPAETNTPQSNPTTVSTLTPLPSETPTSAESIPDTTLLLRIEGPPSVVMQGDELTLRLTINNPGPSAAINVRVRDELPIGLILIESVVDGGTVSAETDPTGITIFTLNWPSLEAGALATANMRVKIADTVPDGAIIDNLAVAWADNGASHTAGISIGMPPALLPTFD